jgi:Holliday junction resolvase RusA-like endonuclease
MRSKSYVISLPPIAWKRSGLKWKPSKDKRKIPFYDQQLKEKIAIGIMLSNQHNDEPLFSIPIHISCRFYIYKPRKTFNIYPIKTPDVDNLCKFLFDVMKDVLITDDRIICSLSVAKVYDSNPRTEFTITEI